jgi:AcrR family transcriptional regulator
MAELQTKNRRDRRREAILDIAGTVFREVGYGAASMSLIAARVGGSKGTLYNYFKSKEELFAAHIQDHCARNAETIFAVPMKGADIDAVLTGVAERFLQLIMSEDGSCLFSLLVEARRNAEISQTFYQSGPATGVHRLAAFLEQARAAGRIDVEDCAIAAEQFLDLCVGHFHLKRLLNLVPLPTDAQIRARAKRIVALFMRAYGTRAPAAIAGGAVKRGRKPAVPKGGKRGRG